MNGMQYHGKWILENRLTKTRHQKETNQQVVIQEETNTNDETTTPPTPRNQTEDTNDVAPPSPDFSNLTTQVGDNPHIRRPPPTESPPIPPITAYSRWIQAVKNCKIQVAT